jgi:hypothetical protein
MKFLVDAHLPKQLAAELNAAGHDALHTLQPTLARYLGRLTIWLLAKALGDRAALVMPTLGIKKGVLVSYTIAPQEVIDYPPEKLRQFESYGVEYIDNRLFALDPEKLLGTRTAFPYIEVAAELFKQMGWAGDGDIELLWLPAFVFPILAGIPPVGVVIWHVKQSEDGLSYLLSPVRLPFEEFSGIQ